MVVWVASSSLLHHPQANAQKNLAICAERRVKAGKVKDVSSNYLASSKYLKSSEQLVAVVSAQEEDSVRLIFRPIHTPTHPQKRGAPRGQVCVARQFGQRTGKMV